MMSEPQAAAKLVEIDGLFRTCRNLNDRVFTDPLGRRWTPARLDAWLRSAAEANQSLDVAKEAG